MINFAEWGYISIEELMYNNASLDRGWKSCTFDEGDFDKFCRKIFNKN
ncbi:MAG: hypothetical protein KGI27_14660 [Thaumarchaeota archaeon]|nr:hypothetical protein [Nitrososphaerota archaeon]